MTIAGKQFFVNGNPFTVKGVVYSPVPIGDNPELVSPYGDYFTQEYSAIYDRDLPLIKAMGANTIRLPYWDPSKNHTDFLDKAYQNGLYVILTFPLTPSKYPDIDSAATDIAQMVKTSTNHPAVLMWVIGNDLDSSYGTGIDLSKINDLALMVKELQFYYPDGWGGMNLAGAITLTGATATGSATAVNARITQVIATGNTLQFYALDGWETLYLAGTITIDGGGYSCPYGSQYSCDSSHMCTRVIPCP